MSTGKQVVAALGVVAVCVLAGCGQGDQSYVPAPSPPTLPAPGAIGPQAQFDRWKAIVLEAKQAPGDMSHIGMALDLSLNAPEYVDKMIDLLVDPATKLESRFLILNSLEAAQTPQTYPRLLKLTQPDVDPVLRTGVVVMLKNANDAAVTARLRELAKDPERRVRLAATMILSEKGDQEMRAGLHQYYFTDGLPPEHRARIVQSLGLTPEQGDVRVFAAATNDAAMAADARAVAVDALGRIGDPASLASLEQCAAGDNPPALKEAAANAVKALKGKLGGVGAP